MNYMNVLALILVIRSLFIISYYCLIKISKNNRMWLYKYAWKQGKNPWVYRLLGLSMLWIITHYNEINILIKAVMND